MTQRITISLTDETAARLDALMLSGGYGNRSEAVRDLIREKTADDVTARGDGSCVAVVSYVYNHHERQLAARMTNHQHEHGELVVSLMHVHVSREDCLETVFLRGPIREVMHFAKAILAEPGVCNGKVNCIPVE